MDRTWLERSVAVVGVAGRFPGARTPRQMFDRLVAGDESLQRFSRSELLDAGVPAEVLDDPYHVPVGGVLDDIDRFDADFFGIGLREAMILDPQDRLFMQTAWHALEDASCDPRRFSGSVGVFASKSQSSYLFGVRPPGHSLDSRSIYDALLGNDKDYLATRFSYAVGLTGPSVSVQTACSSSLVAVHLAVQSLLAGECDLALAGGVTLRVPQKTGYLFEEGGPYAPDGHCRPYDRRASGTVSSEGVAVIALRRADDVFAGKLPARALIRGSAINNDGRSKIGFTAPSSAGQRAVIAEALGVAELRSDQIGFVEGHGTGTPLGDAIELEALTAAFRADTERARFCALGSVKSQLGHLDAAAGVTGLIKAVLVLERGLIPPTLHFAQPNPALAARDTPFFVNAASLPFAGAELRRAGVSAFGVGGTNCHVVLEEGWPRPAAARARSRRRPVEVLLLSARSDAALERLSLAHAQSLEQAARPEHAAPGGAPSLADIAWSTRHCRTQFEQRRAIVATTLERAAEAARNADPVQTCSGRAGPARQVAFLFPGAGVQFPDMGRELYETLPVFREAMDRCFELARATSSVQFRSLLYGTESSRAERERCLEGPAVALPVLFMTQYALAQAWLGCGVRPDMLLGQSLGEYTAACLSGVLSLSDALGLTIHRGQLVETLPPGLMLRVGAAAQAVAPLLPAGVDVAAYSAPDACVVSGSVDAIAEAERALAERFACQRLNVRGAGHSRQVEPIMADLRQRVRRLTLNAPQIPYTSNLTGGWVGLREACDPEYWVAHLRSPVRLGENLELLASRPDLVSIEMGPGGLSSQLRASPSHAGGVAVVSLRHRRDPRGDAELWARALGEAWVHGVDVRWGDEAEAERTAPLPAYPFEPVRHWFQRSDRSVAAGPAEAVPAGERRVALELEAPVTRAAPIGAGGAEQPGARAAIVADELERAVLAAFRDLLGAPTAGLDHDFFALGGTSLIAVQLASALRRSLGLPSSPRLLLEAPTPRRLAERLRSLREATPRREAGPNDASAWAGSQEDVVFLQRGTRDDLPCLSLIHPVGGHVFHYRELALRLGAEWPVLAFPAPGLSGEQRPLAAIGALARHHLQALLERQPRGPYLLAGNSLGGMIAFEMALELRALGHRVALLALLDTPGPEQMPRGLDSEADILLYVFGELLGVPLERDALAAASEPLALVRQRAAEHGVSIGLSDEEARRLVDVFAAHSAAARGYEPRDYPGKLTFFRAAQRRAWDPAHPEFAWIPLAATAEVIRSPGDHVSMLEPPHVDALAAELRQRMHAALSASG